MKYPAYIISKGRWENRSTSINLERLNVPYRIVIEPQEFEQYAAVIDTSKILTLPFSNLGLGSIPARNWVWQHATASGAKRHWIMDDNMWRFRRLVNHEKVWAEDGRMFTDMENFVDQFKNVALAGPENIGNVRADAGQKVYRLNTRIYSCILVNNSLPYRWRGRYNEDTDLALRVLKDGWCTVLFHAFLMDKPARDRGTGGNHDELYAGDGDLKMAQSLAAQHPDVTRTIRRYLKPDGSGEKRWHHKVNYRPFKVNRLVEVSA